MTIHTKLLQCSKIYTVLDMLLTCNKGMTDDWSPTYRIRAIAIHGRLRITSVEYVYISKLVHAIFSFTHLTRLHRCCSKWICSHGMQSIMKALSLQPGNRALTYSNAQCYWQDKVNRYLYKQLTTTLVGNINTIQDGILYCHLTKQNSYLLIYQCRSSNVYYMIVVN